MCDSERNNAVDDDTLIVIKQNILHHICSATGVHEPWDFLSLQELVFRMQIFFPEMLIQSSYGEGAYFFSFFYNSVRHFVRLPDLVRMVRNADKEKSSLESRTEVTADMVNRKAGFIARFIQEEVMILGRYAHNKDKLNYMILPEFPLLEHGRNRRVDEDIFAKKIADAVFR
ncbi:MAG: hypothetical protein IPP86_17690 [Bacteroidetes bacterium]|nr:hypothetical protein [Bacteroidota bacterium]